jgi:hypothetical protein
VKELDRLAATGRQIFRDSLQIVITLSVTVLVVDRWAESKVFAIVGGAMMYRVFSHLYSHFFYSGPRELLCPRCLDEIETE